VPRNATLETLLRHHELPSDTMGSLMQAVASVFNPKKPARESAVPHYAHARRSSVREFQYQIDADRLLRVVATRVHDAPGAAPAFTAEVIELPKTFELTAIAVDIEKGGSPHRRARGQRRERTARTGDGEGLRRRTLTSTPTCSPETGGAAVRARDTRWPVRRYGEIKAAIMDNDGRHLTAIASKDAAGNLEWHDADGKSLKRQFLKSPLFFDPRIHLPLFQPAIPSGARHLPRALWGGFRRPVRTAVRTVANGTVEFAAYSGEAGRMIRIRHTGRLPDRISPLVVVCIRRPRRRARVAGTGHRIRGATGTATGPHLDYRIMKNGRTWIRSPNTNACRKARPSSPRRCRHSSRSGRGLGRMTSLLAAQPPATAASSKPPQR
jgi:hypothetical protein